MRTFLSATLLAGLAALTGTLAWVALDVHLASPLLPQLATVAALLGGLAIWPRTRRGAWGLVGLVTLVHLGWLAALRPSADRDWAAPVARSTTGSIADGVARLRHVRAFEWSDPDTADEAWVDAEYDLSTIARVDLLTSVWDDPDIAHILVTFHFEDGRDLAWSIEVRREADEAFSIRGGFLRAFELALIAAPESDIVDLRVEARGETVRRFPTTLTPEQGAALFEAYVDLGNALVAEPRFYNTITANCTTTAWQIAHVLSDDLPLDTRLILSGNLPGYLHDLGALPGEAPLPDRMEAAILRPAAAAADAGRDRADRRIPVTDLP